MLGRLAGNLINQEKMWRYVYSEHVYLQYADLLKAQMFLKSSLSSFNFFTRRIYSPNGSRHAAATLEYGGKWINVNFADISYGEARQLRCLAKSHDKWWRKKKKKTASQCSFFLVREVRGQILWCFVRPYCTKFICFYSSLKSEEKSELVFSLSLHSHIETRFHTQLYVFNSCPIPALYVIGRRRMTSKAYETTFWTD